VKPSFWISLGVYLLSSLMYAWAQTVPIEDVATPQQADEYWPLELELFPEKKEISNTEKQAKKNAGEPDFDFAQIDSLIPTDRYFTREIEIPQHKKSEFRWPTDMYRAVLRENAIIHDLKTHQAYSVHRKAYVMAQEKIAGGKNIYIYTNAGKKKFVTSSINVIPIENDLDLDPIPKNYLTYAEQPNYQAKDTTLRLDNYINIHGEYMRDTYLADLFISLIPENQTLTSDTFYAVARRFEYKVFYRWDFPIEFGVNLNYQEGSWQGDASGLIWRSIFFGPVAQFSLAKYEKVEYNVQVSFQQSLFFKASSLSNDFQFDYSTNALEVNLNSIWNTRYGHIVLGASMRRAQASLESSSTTLQRNPKRGSMDSISIMLGYNFEWDIGS